MTCPTYGAFVNALKSVMVSFAIAIDLRLIIGSSPLFSEHGKHRMRCSSASSTRPPRGSGYLGLKGGKHSPLVGNSRKGAKLMRSREENPRSYIVGRVKVGGKKHRVRHTSPLPDLRRDIFPESGQYTGRALFSDFRL